MKLQYLPQPGMSAGAGLGYGIGKFGESIAALGQLGADEAQRKKDNELANKTFDLKDREVKVREAELQSNIEIMNNKKADETTKRQAVVNVFKTLHPKVSKSLGNDENIYAYVSEIDKFVPKNTKMNKLDVRITPSGNKILTYEDSNGEVKEMNLGAVKTDWNVKKPSSDIPEGYVSVGKEFYETYADRGMVKSSKDGKFYAPLNFINAMQKEQIGSGNGQLDEEL